MNLSSRTPATPCKACISKELVLINEGLAKRRSIKGMAQRFGVSKFTLYRHRKNHMPPRLLAKILRPSYAAADLEELRITESQGLLANSVAVRDRLYRLAESAERVGDHKAAAQCYGKILTSLELIGRLLNQFSAQSAQVVNNLLITPDYIRLRSALITALADYPEARQAVAKVLREVEAIETEVSGNGNGPTA